MDVLVAEHYVLVTTVVEIGIAQNVRVMSAKHGYKHEKKNYFL
jgi:hypothetical protein